MTNTPENPVGLTAGEVKRLRAQYGRNELTAPPKENLFKKILHIILEPMFLLLLVAATIYFLLGEPRDGFIMLVFVVGIISIDVIQEWKTDRTLAALKDLSAPHITVIRDGAEQTIPSAELVPGDLMMICEGVKIPADGAVLRCADLCVEESSLTGESEGVWKMTEGCAEAAGDYWRKDYCYAGTLVTQGTATIRVEKIGAATEYGKIGKDVAAAPQEDTPLQKQVGKLVKTCAVIAGALFALVGIFTWMNIPDHNFKDRLVESILSGVTLAMAMIPEEFPVILTVFLSMGAWRLAKKHSLVRKLPSVETLGSVSVLCVDKTGTITMNQMSVQELWVASGDEQSMVETMGLGCETDTYDPMEKAMLACCEAHGIPRSHLFEESGFLTEYAFTNELKMMGHVWRHDGEILIAAKGSPERIFTICDLTPEQQAEAERRNQELSGQGLRVIAIATKALAGEAEIPASITDCHLTLLGLVGLADPPRESVKADIAVCNRAGIRVVMITGDNGITASAIAKKIGLPQGDKIITGDMLNAMNDDELREAVKTVSIFSRVVPEHKMRIVRAFRENGEIVAMTGDGVNDAPALKYADIGIAMGKRGSEVSREAADLILMDDNFTTIVETVRDGRRIYDNIRKAVGYVFTIHIPIAFASLLAPFLGIPPTALLLLPLHVVLLEVLIDPTCSIVLERQPAETDIMERRPRDPKAKLLTAGLLGKSILQGVVVFAVSFGAYFTVLAGSLANAPVARSMGLAVIMLANLFLVQVNSSDRDFVFRSARRLAKDPVMWGVNLGTLALLGLILYTPLSGLLKLSALPLRMLLAALGLAAASVLWFELVKLVKK
ncbi:MAG: cation-translocating P-type ATPase, partial [Clostridiaceae bacterium]|nr:cation-translocating P-type ATPase [Clostridiaceae bacterium]